MLNPEGTSSIALRDTSLGRRSQSRDNISGGRKVRLLDSAAEGTVSAISKTFRVVDKGDIASSEEASLAEVVVSRAS